MPYIISMEKILTSFWWLFLDAILINRWKTDTTSTYFFRCVFWKIKYSGRFGISFWSIFDFLKMEMVQNIYISCHLVWSNVVAVASVLNMFNMSKTFDMSKRFSSSAFLVYFYFTFICLLWCFYLYNICFVVFIINFK